MIIRQLTTSGDWTFGAGLGNYATGQQAIALNLKTSILMWQGDFFAALNGWINWQGLMNIGTQKQLNAALQSLISQCYGIMGIVSASVIVNPTTRNFSATYNVTTVYSSQVINQISILSGQPGN